MNRAKFYDAQHRAQSLISPLPFTERSGIDLTKGSLSQFQQTGSEFLRRTQTTGMLNRTGMSRTRQHPQLQDHFFEGQANFRTKEELKQLAKCLIMINKNSPISMRLKNITTLGRPGTDFLRVSKYQDFPYYEQKVRDDKINTLTDEIKEKLRETNSWQTSPFVQVPNYGVRKDKKLTKGLIQVFDPQVNFDCMKEYDQNYHQGNIAGLRTISTFFCLLFKRISYRFCKGVRDYE